MERESDIYTPILEPIDRKGGRYPPKASRFAELPDDDRLAEMLDEIDFSYLAVTTTPSTNFPQLISLAEQARQAIEEFLAYAHSRKQ